MFIVLDDGQIWPASVYEQNNNQIVEHIYIFQKKKWLAY